MLAHLYITAIIQKLWRFRADIETNVIGLKSKKGEISVNYCRGWACPNPQICKITTFRAPARGAPTIIQPHKFLKLMTLH